MTNGGRRKKTNAFLSPCYLVLRLLKPQEDEIAQHYAVKTVENICSQGGDWASKFANTDVAFNLIQIYNSGRGEGLKATTASTLSRLLRYVSHLNQVFVESVFDCVQSDHFQDVHKWHVNSVEHRHSAHLNFTPSNHVLLHLCIQTNYTCKWLLH